MRLRHLHNPASFTRRSCVLLGMAGASGLLTPAMGRADSGNRLVVTVPADVMVDYEKFLAGRDPLTLKNFGGASSRRDVVELVVLQQALQRGGWQEPLELVGMPTSARLLRELEFGSALCSATSFWRDDVSSSRAHFSIPVIESGEFVAGLYTVPSNRRAMGAKNLDDVRKLRALSNRSWVVDWRTLEKLGIADVQHVGQWDVMPRMVSNGRADFLLAPFQATPDLSLVVGFVQLVPIPRLKVGLDGTRHFIVSRAHSQANVFLEALNAGLLQLHRKGVIRQAYAESGFFSEMVANWVRL